MAARRPATSAPSGDPGAPGDDPARRLLLGAANDLLAADGPGALTVRRIAKAAGMSTMNLYSRFGGKDGLVDELFTDGFRRLGQSMADSGTTNDALDDLRRCGQSYRRFALANPTYYAIMFDRAVPDFEPSPAAQAVALETLAELATRLARAMDSGDLTPIDPMAAAASVWATCHGLVSLELRDPRHPGLDWSAIYDFTMATLLRGLAGN